VRCAIPAGRDGWAGGRIGPARVAPGRATWYTDAAKVFDNLYFVGSKIHSSWARASREGIILIDTID